MDGLAGAGFRVRLPVLTTMGDGSRGRGTHADAIRLAARINSSPETTWQDSYGGTAVKYSNSASIGTSGEAFTYPNQVVNNINTRERQTSYLIGAREVFPRFSPC